MSRQGTSQATWQSFRQASRRSSTQATSQSTQSSARRSSRQLFHASTRRLSIKASRQSPAVSVGCINQLLLHFFQTKLKVVLGTNYCCRTTHHTCIPSFERFSSACEHSCHRCCFCNTWNVLFSCKPTLRARRRGVISLLRSSLLLSSPCTIRGGSVNWLRHSVGCEG